VNIAANSLVDSSRLISIPAETSACVPVHLARETVTHHRVAGCHANGSRAVCSRAISSSFSSSSSSSLSLLCRFAFELIEFGLVGSSEAPPRLRLARSLHAALDFVSNKSRGLRNLACDLALMQTVSCAPLLRSSRLPPPTGPPFAPILFLRSPPSPRSFPRDISGRAVYISPVGCERKIRC